MSQLELVACITEENRTRKRKRIMLTKMYFEMSCLALAYLTSQRAPRDLECFSDDEHDDEDAIVCMMGDMTKSFNDALKTTEPLHMPKVSPTAEIFAALRKVPELDHCDMLRAYGKLIMNERLFEALIALPENLKKSWLLTLP